MNKFDIIKFIERGYIVKRILIRGILIVLMLVMLTSCQSPEVTPIAEKTQPVEANPIEESLETVALNRWKYYLYLRVVIGVAVPLAILIPPLVLMLLIPLIAISILVFVLMMGLMKQAENLLG